MQISLRLTPTTTAINLKSQRGRRPKFWQKCFIPLANFHTTYFPALREQISSEIQMKIGKRWTFPTVKTSMRRFQSPYFSTFTRFIIVTGCMIEQL